MIVAQEEDRPRLLPVVGTIFVMYVCIMTGAYFIGNYVL
jgi:hypothetical protein